MKIWNKILKATQFASGCVGTSTGSSSGLHGYEGAVQTDGMVPQVATEPTKAGWSKREIALATTAAIGVGGTAWAINNERKRRSEKKAPAPAVAEATDSSDKS